MRYLPVLILVSLLLVGCSAREQASDVPATTDVPVTNESLPAAPLGPSVRPDVVRADVTVRQSGDGWRVRIDRVLEQNVSSGARWTRLREGDEVDATFMGKILVVGAPVSKVECPLGSVAQPTNKTIQALADSQDGMAGDLVDGSYVAQLNYGYFSADDEAAKKVSAAFSIDVPFSAPIELECIALNNGP